MSDKVKRDRRRYHSPTRTAQAQATRQRILDAGLELFLDRGYAGTTVAAVAERANVVPETVYLACGGKRGLLKDVIETAITGEEDSAARYDGTWWDALASIPSARVRLEKMVEYSCGVLARTSPIHVVIRGAADKEPFAAALGRRLLHDRVAAQTERIRRYLEDGLRPGMSPSEAGERYCVLTSPEVHHLLTVEFGWSTEQHRSWLGQLLETDLLGPDT
jgi:AcrR family transcriptional regulator